MDEQQLAAIALEDATPDDQLSQEARRRKEARLKKRAARTKERQQKFAKAKVKAEAAAAESYDEIQQFWNANRAKLTEAERAEFEEQHDYVLGLMEAMDDYVHGTDGTTPQDLQDTITEVQEAVRQFGLCSFTVLNVPRIWTEDEADLRKRIEAREQLVGRGNATSTLINLGYYVAIIERLYEDFRQKFVVERVVIPQYWETITCACGAEDYVQAGTVEDYRRARRGTQGSVRKNWSESTEEEVKHFPEASLPCA